MQSPRCLSRKATPTKRRGTNIDAVAAAAGAFTQADIAEEMEKALRAKRFGSGAITTSRSDVVTSQANVPGASPQWFEDIGRPKFNFGDPTAPNEYSHIKSLARIMALVLACVLVLLSCEVWRVPIMVSGLFVVMS